MATRKFKLAKARRRQRVRRSVRKRVFGTAERPRLTVFRSNKYIYAQLIDDVRGHTLVSASSLEKEQESGSPMVASQQVGGRLAARAREAGVSAAVFDRNGYRYHGRIQALATGARNGGLTF